MQHFQIMYKSSTMCLELHAYPNISYLYKILCEWVMENIAAVM